MREQTCECRLRLSAITLAVKYRRQGGNRLNAKRRFETLSDTELHYLMQLALEGGLYANADTQALGKFLGTLAADVGFELWLRDQRRTDIGCTRIRPADIAYSKARARTH